MRTASLVVVLSLLACSLACSSDEPSSPSGAPSVTPPQMGQVGAPIGAGNGQGAAAGSAASGAQPSMPGMSPGLPNTGTTMPGAVPANPTEPLPASELGYSELPNGKGGVNLEQVSYPASMGFDKERSLQAFQTTVYPLLRENCGYCHSSDSKAQAPMHSDVNPVIAHEYALTRVNFRKPVDSKLVVRMAIDRHNCFRDTCKQSADEMLKAVQAWADAVAPLLPETPRPVPAGEMVSEDQVRQWIADDKKNVAAADADFIKYVSLHELHDAGVSAEELNIARVAVSKALNSTARWAPAIENPVDINGKGLVYRFDTRDYWGHNKGVQKLHFGGSDDDLFFGSNKSDVEGNAVNASVMNERYNFAKTVSDDPAFAQLVWKRVLYGNVEGAVSMGTIPANVDGFKDDYVEAGQLVYTLTRPDVYNAIMAIPWYANELEDELGVVRDKGMDSYQYIVTQQAITVDSRLYYRARTASGFYWKTFDIFTGQEDTAHPEKMRFPFWAHPIPKFISGTGGGVSAQSLSFIASLAQPLKTQIDGNAELTKTCEGQTNYGGADTFYNCRYYTGQDGLQQSAEESIWNMPNGLQGYALFGGFNQRRVDAFVNIVRDPRLLRNADDFTVSTRTGFAATDLRLNEGGSCLGCHTDGLNRGNDDMREWLEAGTLPQGETGTDSWINDEATKQRVRELYPTNDVIRPQVEDDRRIYLEAMAKIRSGMVLGVDKNVYVEPIVWTFEWTQKHYMYQATRSN